MAIAITVAVLIALNVGFVLGALWHSGRIRPDVPGEPE